MDPDRPAEPAAAAADPAAFVLRHQRGLVRWLTALGCEPDAADEHAQDALLAALHHGLHARPAGTAWSWLRTTARNLHWMQLRRQRRRPAVAEFDEVEAAWLLARGDRDGGDAALEALRACLAAADERDRDLVYRRYAVEQSRGEMAQALGLDEAGVKQALRRARARLRDCVHGRLDREPQQERR